MCSRERLSGQWEHQLYFLFCSVNEVAIDMSKQDLEEMIVFLSSAGSTTVMHF